MRLSALEFDAEKQYQGLMSILRIMLKDGLMTADEYAALCGVYADRLKPKSGALLSRHALLCTENRVNMVPEEVNCGEDNAD